MITIRSEPSPQGAAMDDEERLEGEEEMELDEASDGDDDDEEASGMPVSPANSDQLMGVPPNPGNGKNLFKIIL